jgi:hypothetical protein
MTLIQETCELGQKGDVVLGLVVIWDIPRPHPSTVWSVMHVCCRRTPRGSASHSRGAAACVVGY